MRALGTILTAAAMTLSAPAAAQDAVGDWNGTLVAGPTTLRIVVHIARGADGALGGTLDSPDQNVAGIALAGVTADGGSLSFTVPSVGGAYRASWDPAAALWKGTWVQNQAPLPLDLRAGLPSGEAPSPPAALPADWRPPADSAVREMIAARNAPRAGQGIVVGVLDPSGRRVISGGTGAGAAFDGRTLFEIGSISKVFTALLLADMASKGEVSLDDPAEKYLPAGHHMPQRGGRQITLRDLSTHVSGLPRLPSNMEMSDPDDPYRDYTEAQMLAFLDSYALPRDIGAQWEYSNFGVGLLGYLLGRAAGKDYEVLLRERITGPLGMKDTAITLPPALAARLAPAFDPYMRPAKPWNLPTLMGAGGIRSTADDMLTFAAAVLDPKSPIAPAVKTALAVRVPTGNAKVEQALGWQIVEVEPGRELVLHDGGTGGFRSSLAIEPAKGTAAVVLINTALEPSATDLALHVLVGSPIAPTPPVPPPPPEPVRRVEVSLPQAELDRVTGRYEFAPGVVFSVVRDGSGLRAQREGAVTGPALPIFAESPLHFFWKAVDAQVLFTTDESGRVTGAVFTQSGQSMTGKRLED